MDLALNRNAFNNKIIWQQCDQKWVPFSLFYWTCHLMLCVFNMDKNIKYKYKNINEIAQISSRSFFSFPIYRFFFILSFISFFFNISVKCENQNLFHFGFFHFKSLSILHKSNDVICIIALVCSWKLQIHKIQQNDKVEIWNDNNKISKMNIENIEKKNENCMWW